MLSRIAKMLAALGTGVGVTLLTQFLLPPTLIRFYGVVRYGEWLVLSATISYLSTLNFGVTTYASNELTMMVKRGNLQDYKRLQGSTLALLLGVLALGSAASLLAFLLPLRSLLHLATIADSEARFCALYLGLLAMSNILAGYYSGLFMVIEQAHRGTFWYNWRRLASALAVLPLAACHVSFSTLAAGQAIAVSVVTLASIFDLRARMDTLPLGLSGADWQTVRASLKPSAMFAMVFAQNFMVFQVPVILLQRLVGAELVVVFTVSRTLLATARQLLQTVTNAIAPEITFSYGAGEMSKLLAIFHQSEKLVFFLIPVANLGAFLFAPLVLQFWLHDGRFFHPWLCAFMALISGAMSMREHKQFFQFSTNVHKQLSLIVFLGNLLMLIVSIPATIRFGVSGFLLVWLISELAQMALLYRENKLLFGNHDSITIAPVMKLVGFMLVALPLCYCLVMYGEERSRSTMMLIAFAGVVLIALPCYFLFGLSHLRTYLPLRGEKLA